MALILKQQTVAQFVARLRVLYRDGDPPTVLKIARFILSRIAAGDFTDLQVRTAFSKTAAQWTTLKDKMIALVNAANTVSMATGE